MNIKLLTASVFSIDSKYLLQFVVMINSVINLTFTNDGAVFLTALR